MTDWLAQGEASASQGYLTSENGPLHRPSREWYGQVMPGSWAPNINANSADYDLDAGARAISGDTNRWDYTEDWIFQRPSTMATGQPGTITSQTCPNCGASVNVDITSICPFCDAAVITGKFGWLLTRIDRV